MARQKKQPKIVFPAQPEMDVLPNGDIKIDIAALNRYHKGMDKAKAQWDQAMQGAENDPDEIMRRMFTLFKP